MIEKFFEYEIIWKADLNTAFFKTNFNDTFRLRMNDFPEEPMYTFIAMGEEVDFDDLPSNWKIDYSYS